MQCCSQRLYFKDQILKSSKAEVTDDEVLSNMESVK